MTDPSGEERARRAAAAGDADADDIAALEACVRRAIDAGHTVDADALLFLLTHYLATRREDVADLAGRALASAVARERSSLPTIERAAWLRVFVAAHALSDDERLHDVVDADAGALRDAWTSASVEESAASLDACLLAAHAMDDAPLASDAIDRLEQIVAAAYHPGRGAGTFADQVRMAFALLAAYEISGRLPYPMLAEELAQIVRREDCGDFTISCEASRLFSRLAVLHAGEIYRRTAILTPDSRYLDDAAQRLMAQAAEARRRGALGAIYGVAQLELKSAISITQPDSTPLTEPERS